MLKDILLKVGNERGKAGFMLFMLANAGCGDGIAVFAQTNELVKLDVLQSTWIMFKLCELFRPLVLFFPYMFDCTLNLVDIWKWKELFR